MNKVKLKDIAEIIMGQSPESKYVSFSNIGLPLLNGPAEFTDKYPNPVQYTNDSKRLAKKNDILFCVRGSTTGRMNIADQKYSIGRGLASIRHKNASSLNIYIKAIIECNLKKLLGGTLGSVFPNLTKDNLFELEFYCHDLNTQQKIASVLSALDDKIELNNKINTELEQMAKTLYDYWFVQFDFPNEEDKPYKSSGGKMVYNDVLKREIPEGWEVTVFNNWIKQTKTGDWGKEQVEGNYTERVYCVRGADINGLNGKGEVKAPERFILKNNLSKVLESNDFIIEISGGSPTQSTARIALLTKETFDRFDTDVVCSNFCKAVTLENESYVYNFQQEWQRLYDAGVFFGFEGKTSGIKNFLFESFMDSYNIVKPSDELVLKYNAIAKEVEKKKQLNLKQNKELADLRDWLLPMLMNGQVSVGDVVDQEANIVKGDRRIRDLFGDEEYLRRKALAVYIVNQSLGDKSFGKTKFMKLLHLVEYHIVQGSLEQAYYKHAAGPYDGAFATKFWNEVIEDKWYRIEELGSLNHIISGEKYKETQDYTSSITDDLKQEIKAFIHIFKDCNYEQPEVVSTLYAVWNNRIIQKEMITDALLKQDFLAWDEQKEKYIDKLDKALGWMRSNKIVPTGWGKVIKASKSRRGEI